MITSIRWNNFPRYWPFERGIQWSPVNSPHKGQWRGALMFYLICSWINDWVNNRGAGDLRRHRIHYVIIVMLPLRLVTIIARSPAVCEWRAPASVTSPVWKNPIHRNPFLVINQIHKYTQMTHTFFDTYECTKLLCVSLTRFYHDSFSFKENTYPVLNQRHISVDIRTAPFLPEPITRDRVFQNRPFHSERPAAYCRKSHSCYRHQGTVSVWYLDLHY